MDLLRLEIELVVAKIIYRSHYNPSKTKIECRRGCEFLTPSPTILSSQWIDNLTWTEQLQLQRGMTYVYAEYMIKTGDVELFHIGQKRYDRITLVLIDDVTHWLFFYTRPNFENIKGTEGKGVLEVSYGPCCIRDKFADVIRAIKNHIVNEPINV